MKRNLPSPAEKRRILQLETLYDLAMAFRAERSEEELVDELLQQVCSVLDPAAAVAVTQDGFGEGRSVAAVGWAPRPTAAALLADPVGRRLATEGELLTDRQGELAGRPFQQLIAAPLIYRTRGMGYLAVLDKEARGRSGSAFTEDDGRFLESVAALAGVSLDSARQLERLEVQRERLEEENRALKGRLADTVTGQRIVADSAPMREALTLVERVAPRGVNVLVRGESGTGKELIAKLLHLLSQRSGSLIAVNCAALPESLLESELFGIERGVATGVQARPGKFELADSGTLFLDEVGDMAPALQAKLLRVIQEREVLKVGGRRPITVDVRLVTATHRDLETLVQESGFREDLYYRLKGVEIELPPLRERAGDIPRLVRYFTEDFCRRESIPAPRFSSDATALLLGYDYPGNVRELQNVIEGAVSLADGEVNGELLRPMLGSAAAVEESRARSGKLEALADLERRHIQRVLRKTGGNKSAAARILGIDRRTLLRKGF